MATPLVDALNKARADAIASGTDPYAGSLRNLSAYGSANPSLSGSVGGAPGSGTTPAQAYQGLSVGNPDPGDAALATAIGSAKTNSTNVPNERQIYRDKLALYQAEIDATNRIYADQLARAKNQGLSNLGSGRAIQARSGTLGSDFGAAQTDKITEANTATEQLIQAEQSAKISSILGFARKDATDEIAAKRAAQEKGLSDYITYLGQQTTRRTSNLAKIAAAVLDQGLSIDKVDPTQLAAIAKSYGVSVDDIKEGVLTETKVRADAKTASDAKARSDNSFDLSEGQSYYQYDPETGGYKLIASKAKTYAPKEASGGAGSGIYDTLDYRTANAVIAQGNTFTGNPIVKKYNELVGAANLINGVDPSTVNPADHQAIIYNFAKALDPESVVREGEYETIKKYSQSLLSKYKGEIKQAVAGNGFLSEQAIRDIQAATANRVASYEPQYQNVRKQTASRINSIAGKDVADMVLLDFEEGYSDGASDIGDEDPNAGKVHVRISNGQTGYIDPEEYDPATMQKI